MVVATVLIGAYWWFTRRTQSTRAIDAPSDIKLNAAREQAEAQAELDRVNRMIAAAAAYNEGQGNPLRKIGTRWCIIPERLLPIPRRQLRL